MVYFVDVVDPPWWIRAPVFALPGLDLFPVTLVWSCSVWGSILVLWFCHAASLHFLRGCIVAGGGGVILRGSVILSRLYMAWPRVTR